MRSSDRNIRIAAALIVAAGLAAVGIAILAEELGLGAEAARRMFGWRRITLLAVGVLVAAIGALLFARPQIVSWGVNRRQDHEDAEHWPAVFNVRPGLVVWAAGLIVALAWAAVLAVDVIRVLPDRPPPELWPNLFNDRPVEYLQWLMLPTTAILAGYLSARMPDRRVAAFLLLFAVAVTLVFIEDAGDIRHHLRLDEIDIWAFVQLEMLYFAALASVPIYALLRYGRDVWRFRRVRGYLVAGYVLYGIAAVGAAFSARIYQRMGEFVDERLLGGRFPVETVEAPDWWELPEELWEVSEGAAAEWTHYSIMDALVEESLETIAVACLLAAVLAMAAYARNGDPEIMGGRSAPRREQ